MADDKQFVELEKFNQTYAELNKMKDENLKLKGTNESLSKRISEVEVTLRTRDVNKNTKVDIQKELLGINWDKMGMTQKEWEKLYDDNPVDAINSLVNYKMTVGGEYLTGTIVSQVKVDAQQQKDLDELAKAFPTAFKNAKSRRKEFSADDPLGKLFLDELLGDNRQRYLTDTDGVRVLKIAVEEKYKEIYGKEPESKALKTTDDAGNFVNIGGGDEPPPKKKVDLSEEELANAKRQVADGTFKDIDEYIHYKNMRTVE